LGSNEDNKEYKADQDAAHPGKVLIVLYDNISGAFPQGRLLFFEPAGSGRKI
jgi:hypothetical protein